MKNVFITGHKGLVGSSFVRNLDRTKYNIITVDKRECNLLDYQQIHRFLSENKVDVMIMAAAKVGGIWANKTQGGQFIYENMTINTNCIHAAKMNKVPKVIFLGSSCIYPKICPHPIKEEYLLSGELEWTNEPYAVAKIAGIKMAEAYNRQYGIDYHSIMPCNLYGINDSYSLENAHVIPSLILKMQIAKDKGHDYLQLMGTGNALREFLIADDVVEATKLLIEEEFPPSLLNVGSGQEISIHDLAHLIKDIVGYKGVIAFTGTLDGTMRKTMDSSKMRKYGWEPKVSLEKGIEIAYSDFSKRLWKFAK